MPSPLHLHVDAYEDFLSPPITMEQDPFVVDSEHVGDVVGHVEYVVEMFPTIPFS